MVVTIRSEKEGRSDGRRLNQHQQDGDQFFATDREPVLLTLELHTTFLGRACPGDPEIIDGSAYSAAMEAVEKVE